MDAKIPATFWSDPDLDEKPPEVCLTLLWAMTNPARNGCGAYRFSATRFGPETRGLAPEWHEKTLAAFPDRFVRDGHWVLYLPFIRECLQLGDIVGRNGGINKGAQALAKPFQALPKPLQRALLDTYPELAVVWRKPSASPSQALHDSEAPGKPLPSLSDVGDQDFGKSEARADGGPREGLGKPLPSPRAEQSRAEQSRAEGIQGEGSGGALVPSEEEVLAYGRQFKDLSTGQGPIPDSYCRKWLAWRLTEKAGPFPRDWKKDLRLRFLADVEDKKIAAPAVSAESRAAIEAELKKLPHGDARRAPLLAKLNTA